MPQFNQIVCWSRVSFWKQLTVQMVSESSQPVQWMSGLLCYKDELNKQVCCLTAYILRDQSSYTRGVSNTLDKKLFHPVQAFIVNEKDRPLESSAFLPSWLDLSTIKLRKLEFVLPEKIRNIMLGIHWLRNIQKIFKFDSLFWAFVWLK